LNRRKRNQEERRRKIYMMFANLKAAFDKMDRDKLWETLRGKGK